MKGKRLEFVEKTILNQKTMKSCYLLFLLVIISSAAKSQSSDIRLEVISLHPTPVIGKATKGAEDNKFGFEGGTVQKIKDRYYLFSTEIFDNPKTAKVRLALWMSKDGLTFLKQQVLISTNNNWNDKTYNMSPWSPMSVFDEDTQRWNIFYVGYRRKPNSADVFNMSGKIRRLEASKKGRDGINSTYINKGLIRMTSQPDPWEGPAELVSFYPYKAAGQWYAFYGSNTVPPEQTGSMSEPKKGNTPKSLFWVGLATPIDNKLSGSWKRLSAMNPVLMDSTFMENPVVTKVSDSLYVNLYDGANKHEFSYSLSKDGIHWDKEKLIRLSNAPEWIYMTRTPLCLIPEGDNVFTIYFTAFDGDNSKQILPIWHNGYGNIGMMKVKLIL